MNTLYCAQCGKQLSVLKRGLPKMALMIEVVEPHVCPEEPMVFCPPNKDQIKFVNDPGSYKFVQSLNGLEPPPRPTYSDPSIKVSEPRLNKIPRSSMTGTDDLRDRRFDPEVKSTAPSDVLGMIERMRADGKTSVPERDLPLEEESEGSDNV